MKNLFHNPGSEIFSGLLIMIFSIILPMCKYFEIGFSGFMGTTQLIAFLIIFLVGVSLFISGLRKTKLWKNFNLESFLAVSICVLIMGATIYLFIYGIFIYKF